MLAPKVFLSLRQGQIVRNSLKVGLGLVLLHSNGFEEQNFAMHIDVQQRDFPMPRSNCRLVNVELTTLVQMPEQAAAKLDRVYQFPSNFRQPVLESVDPDSAIHAVEHRRLV